MLLVALHFLRHSPHFVMSWMQRAILMTRVQVVFVPLLVLAFTRSSSTGHNLVAKRTLLGEPISYMGQAFLRRGPNSS